MMSARTIRVPGTEHPIRIEPSTQRVLVTLYGVIIADSRCALTLREAEYPAVFYIPRTDVDISLLKRSNHTSYCPYKGKAAYFSIDMGGDRAVNAIWTYEQPFEAVAQIKNHLAFYPDRVDAITVTDL